MDFSIYLILLIVLLIFNLVFWLLVIWFRILFNCDLGICCSDTESTDDDSPPTGQRNRGFIDDDPVDTPQMPFTVHEAMESPPSYEEALKHDQFGFQVAPTVNTASSSFRSDAANFQQDPPPPAGGGNRPTQLCQNPPRVPDVRSRSSTSGSVCPLTPISEEESDETPVTVVIDCIGVQASRLIPNCDTKVEIADGERLNGQSKC